MEIKEKKILGLDLGTNSIGGTLISIPADIQDYGKQGNIEWMGSRIIPMTEDVIKEFTNGAKGKTKASVRRGFRMSRRVKFRYKLRRTRLLKTLKLLGWISPGFPEDFKSEIYKNENYKFNINEFLPFEENTIEEALQRLKVKKDNGKLPISQDWIVYYLREKALREKISLHELVRIIYMMNQRRGFKSGRKDIKSEENEESIQKEVKILKINYISEIEEEGKRIKKQKYSVNATDINGIIVEFEIQKNYKPDWEEKELSFLVTTVGTKISYTLATENEWEYEKAAFEEKLNKSGLNPGEYFFGELIKDKNYKIRQRIIDRKYYKNELVAIWEKQSEYHPELKSKECLQKIAEMLYENNKAKQQELKSRDLLNIICNDIIYYQRELKSQKKLISECKFEKIKFFDKDKEIIKGFKVAPKSSPEFQEYRIWQDINNIRIIQKEKTINGKRKINVDVTNLYLNNNIKEKIYELFDSNKEISEKKIFKCINENLNNDDFEGEDKFTSDKSSEISNEYETEVLEAKTSIIESLISLSDSTHKINLFENRTALIGNETKYYFRKIFKGNDFNGDDLLSDSGLFYKLWHILYSINSTDIDKSKKGIKNGLKKLNYNLPDNVIESLSVAPDMSKQYAAFSSKAIKKLLTFNRCGKFWNWENIDIGLKGKIEKIISGVWADSINDNVRDIIIEYFKKAGKNFDEIKESDFQGLPSYIACYLVYGIHSEINTSEKFSNYREMDISKMLPPNCLRNPIVEQIIRETLHVVKDVWKTYGRPDEIHIEMGRDLKKNAIERKRLSEITANNFKEKERIKKFLIELVTGKYEFEKIPNPNSPIDIEKFKIYESSSGMSFSIYEKEQIKNNSKWKPTSEEIKKYALWLSQKCISPYTGVPITLSKLFTSEYEADHIIPRSKLKYDSPENLVICESGVNKIKGNKLAANFILESPQTISYGGTNYMLLSYDDYVENCKRIFKGKKLQNLLRDDVPKDFISRQLNDTRYITRKISELLLPVAGYDNGLIFTNGSITSELKQNWGLSTLWKDLMKPRFERLQKITNEQYIYQDDEDKNKYHINAPNGELDIKRIDHRHHALDALIIATTTREHIRYLNTLEAADSEKEIKIIKHSLVKSKIREFKLPWESFTKDAKDKLSEMIVTFKKSSDVITKPQNRYIKWVNENGKWHKIFYNQKQNDKWLAIRRSMFKQPHGVRYLKSVKSYDLIKSVEIQISRNINIKDENGMPRSYIYNKQQREEIKQIIDKVGNEINDIKKYLKKNPLKINGKNVTSIDVAEFKEYGSKKVVIDSSFTLDKINKIPYAQKNPIAKLLKDHLMEFGNNPKDAFENKGKDVLNKKFTNYINKITIVEEMSKDSKFKGQYLETDKGSNVYFVMYEDEAGERKIKKSISTLKVIQNLLNNIYISEDFDGLNKIILEPNDLVYVPRKDEKTNNIDYNNKKQFRERIYRVKSFTGNRCFYVPNDIAISIDKNYIELGPNNKSEFTWDDIKINDFCVKINVDRLGNLILPE